jgi:hypothetical protein
LGAHGLYLSSPTQAWKGHKQSRSRNAYPSIVATGLDPVVHAEDAKAKQDGESHTRQLCMDCRVKPGNDDAEAHSRDAFLRPSLAKPLHENRLK